MPCPQPTRHSTRPTGLQGLPVGCKRAAPDSTTGLCAWTQHPRPRHRPARKEPQQKQRTVKNGNSKSLPINNLSACGLNSLIKKYRVAESHFRNKNQLCAGHKWLPLDVRTHRGYVWKAGEDLVQVPTKARRGCTSAELTLSQEGPQRPGKSSRGDDSVDSLEDAAVHAHPTSKHLNT